MSSRHVAVLAACALTCAGCASVVDGSTQQITIATMPVNGADCTASNSRGSWSVVSPGAVMIDKSESVLTIRCSKVGWLDGKFYASGKMSTAGLVGAMIPYAGIVSSAVNASTGAVLTYPDSYIVEMKPAPSAAAGAQPLPATPTADPAPAKPVN